MTLEDIDRLASGVLGRAVPEPVVIAAALEAGRIVESAGPAWTLRVSRAWLEAARNKEIA